MDLDGDVSLIVVHRKDRVVAAIDGLGKHAVGRDGADCFDALRARIFDCRRYLLRILAPQQPTLTSMRVERGYADAGALEAVRL